MRELSATEVMAELGALWYEFVTSDNSGHKDRDCHFIIEQYFSYGDAPYWTALHAGYVDDGFGWSAGDSRRGERRFETYGAALIYCVEQTFEMFRRNVGELPAATVDRLSELSAYWKAHAYARDSDGPRMAETPQEARGEAGPARAEGIAR